MAQACEVVVKSAREAFLRGDPLPYPDGTASPDEELSEAIAVCGQVPEVLDNIRTACREATKIQEETSREDEQGARAVIDCVSLKGRIEHVLIELEIVEEEQRRAVLDRYTAKHCAGQDQSNPGTPVDEGKKRGSAISNELKGRIGTGLAGAKDYTDMHWDKRAGALAPGGALVAGTGAAHERRDHLTTGSGSGDQGLRIAAPPIPPEGIDRAFGEALDTRLRRFPTGRTTLESVKDASVVVAFEYTAPDNMGGVENAAQIERDGKPHIIFNTYRVDQVLKSVDTSPETKRLNLTDPGTLRRYLSTHPEMLTELADHFDSLYVHELTHVAQNQRYGESTLLGKIGAAGEGVIDFWKCFAKCYPIEREYEAFETQDQYYHEKVLTDPEYYLRTAGGKILRDQRGRYTSGIMPGTLEADRRSTLADYGGAAVPVQDLLGFDKDKADYPARMRLLDARWRKRSYEGNLAYAKLYLTAKSPFGPLMFLDRARRTAMQRGNQDESRREMTEVFNTVLGNAERALDSPKGLTVNPRYKTILTSMSESLGIPLPPRLAALVNSGS